MINKTYKAAIFDLDGTLIDSVQDIGDALNAVLKQQNFPQHSLSDYKRLVGNGIKQLVFDALPKDSRSEKVVANCIKGMFTQYSNNCLNATKPYEGINELLDYLESQSIPYAVLSNKADEFAKQMTKSLFPNHTFTTIKGTTTEELKKPNPQTTLEICDLFGIDKKNVVFVGDSGVDIQTAHNAGLDSAGVLWGFKPKEELVTFKATHIISTVEELTELFK